MSEWVAKVNRTKMRTNDGSTVPTGDRNPRKTANLDRNSSFDNSEAFNRGKGVAAARTGDIQGMHSWKPGENLDDPGLDASGGCFYKFGIPYGETAMFNQLPPGPDIDDQAYMLFNEMKLVTYSGGVTYPGDTPWPVRDIPE